MNTLIFNLKREYWEYKRLLVVVPLIVTGLFFLIAMVTTWSHHFVDLNVSINEKNDPLEYSVSESPSANLPSTEGADIVMANNEEASHTAEEEFWFSGVYLAAAWLAAVFYALACLFNDRRDRSILYWKTMPVSELETVFAKLIFSILGFSVFAIGISWISAIVLIVYAHAVFPPEVLITYMGSMNFSKLVIWPFVAIMIGLFWCAPVFALLLYVSAYVKKMPLLTLSVAIIVVSVIERLVFGSNHIIDFLAAHSPFSLLSNFSEMESVGAFLYAYLINSFPSLAIGLVTTGLLIWRTAWHRTHNFEIN